MTARRTNVAGLEHRKTPGLPGDSPPPPNRLREADTRAQVTRKSSHQCPSWITCSFQMPFRERCSHPPLLYRDLGNRRRTRPCLWALVLASRTNDLRPTHPTAVGPRGREHRGRITSPSSMAAVTTLMIRRKHHTHFRTTRSLLECEYSLTWPYYWFEHIRTSACEERERERETWANCSTNYRDLLDHAFLRSVARTSAVDFRVPPTRVLELGCGVCGISASIFSFKIFLRFEVDATVSIRVTISFRIFPALPPFSVDNFFSRATGLSTPRRNGQIVNSCVYSISHVSV